MSVNGRVIPNTPLAVDFWHVRKCPGTRLFFLSHMHSDHTVGLTSTWSNRPIYCSPTTAALLRLKLQVKEMWIHPLELDGPCLLPLDDIGKERLTVTLIDANHCPGAVMFLFEGYFGSILYTGDFRYTPSMLREPCLWANTTIDVLYLDNTNCDPNRPLPSRQRATQQIKEIIRRYPDHNVVIGLYTLGKETLLVELAMEFKSWIEVSVERMETLKVLELPDVFTTEPGAGRFRVVEQSQICSATLQQWNRGQPTLAIIPTSRPQLEDFVSALKPTSLVPIVGNYVPVGFSALLPGRKRQDILVPESVRHYMLRQTEGQLGSSSSSWDNHRGKRSQGFVPTGVIFETPEKESGKSCGEAECTEQGASEGEVDTESSEEDSDCIFVDVSKDLTPNKNRRGTRDMWRLNIIQRVSEDAVMAETVPFSQLSQSNFAPMKILRNTKPCLMSVRRTRGSIETNAEMLNNTTSKENDSGQCSRYGDVHNQHVLSVSGGMSGHSAQGYDQISDAMSNEQINNTGTTFLEELYNEKHLRIYCKKYSVLSCILLSSRLFYQLQYIGGKTFLMISVILNNYPSP
uniref:5' exonuclease Apollo n=1 Tax=Gasterosteus aculeatus aculeatus TaxID=481459 RepID=G3NZC0_GASAC